jgi:cytochrome c-type biogenesis protein CcmE
VSGRVAPQTLRIQADRALATFSLQGTAAEIAVSCRGPLPDNLAEDMEVVVEGTLQPTVEPGSALQLRGDKVLTRCASKYQAAAR